jgi:hypothetical protein
MIVLIKFFYALKALNLQKGSSEIPEMWLNYHDAIIKDFDQWCGGLRKDD